MYVDMEDNIKMDRKETRCEDADCIDLTTYINHQRPLVDTVMNCWFP